MDISAIPNNMEIYIAFMLGKHLIFLDSFQCMSSSLDRLPSKLLDEAFKYTSEIFLDETSKIRVFIHMTTWIVLRIFMRNCPKKNNFYSILQDGHISDERYKHAENIWQTFNLNTMGECHDICLKSV